jgi:hypothetical protein
MDKLKHPECGDFSGNTSGCRSDTAKKSYVRHSGLGIISSIMGIVGFFVTFILVAMAAFLYRQGIDETSAAIVLLGLFIFADIIFLASGMAIGLAGFFNPYRKRLFCVLGVLFNLSIMAALILLLMAGLKP